MWSLSELRFFYKRKRKKYHSEHVELWFFIVHYARVSFQVANRLSIKDSATTAWRNYKRIPMCCKGQRESEVTLPNARLCFSNLFFLQPLISRERIHHLGSRNLITATWEKWAVSNMENVHRNPKCTEPQNSIQSIAIVLALWMEQWPDELVWLQLCCLLNPLSSVCIWGSWYLICSHLGPILSSWFWFMLRNGNLKYADGNTSPRGCFSHNPFPTHP